MEYIQLIVRMLLLSLLKGEILMEKKYGASLPIEETEELASFTECTGLTPAAVQTPEEGESYAELYAIHQQKTAWKDGDSPKGKATRS